MLSTLCNIEAGDEHSSQAGTQMEVDTANATVNWADEMWVDVQAAGTDAMGLNVTVYIAAEDSRIGIQGLPGPPGGVTDFQGSWTISTTYQAGDIVIHNGTVYIVTADHTSDAMTEPGVGVDWEDFLAPFIDLPQTRPWRSR